MRSRPRPLRPRLAAFVCLSLATGGVVGQQPAGMPPPLAASPSISLSLQRPAPTSEERHVPAPGPLRKHLWTASIEVGGGLGFRTFGGEESHDFLLTSLQTGRIVSGLIGQDHWYQGYVEILAHVTAGAQLDPELDYYVSLNPGLRYHFATSRRIIPFLHFSAGVGATDILTPDLSTVFQFNEQAGAGVHWFLRDDLALTAEYRLIHISNARIRRPNRGVNSNLIFAGVAWFF